MGLVELQLKLTIVNILVIYEKYLTCHVVIIAILESEHIYICK